MSRSIGSILRWPKLVRRAAYAARSATAFTATASLKLDSDPTDDDELDPKSGQQAEEVDIVVYS